MSTVEKIFANARAEGRAALVGYLPAGYPTVDGSVEMLSAMVDGGCDLLEVGVPYSDPVMDGPTIQAAADTALRGGVRLRDVFSVVERVAAAGGRAVVMTYFNPVLRYGVDAFARDLAAAGGLGVITPDLIPDEAGEWIAASDTHGLDRIFLVAPSSTEERHRLDRRRHPRVPLRRVHDGRHRRPRRRGRGRAAARPTLPGAHHAAGRGRAGCAVPRTGGRARGVRRRRDRRLGVRHGGREGRGRGARALAAELAEGVRAAG